MAKAEGNRPGSRQLRQGAEGDRLAVRPRPPLKTINTTDIQGQPVSFTNEEWFKRRQDVRESGGQALEWERPPQERLDGKTRMLSTGKPVTCRA